MLAPRVAKTITVIIPTLNEEQRIGTTLEHTRPLGFDAIVVVDGGSSDRTCAIVTSMLTTGSAPSASPSPPGLQSSVFSPITWLSSAPGRARQLNAGAASSPTDILLFLHADTELPTQARALILQSLDDGDCVGGRFDVRFDRETRSAKIVAWFMNRRSRLTGISTGDQAIFVRRRVFEELGGFAEIPLMEDIEFTRRLKRAGKIAALTEPVVTSYRRWETNGPIRTILLMWLLRFLYWVGVSPAALSKVYRTVR